MTGHREIQLPNDAAAALETLQQESAERPVVVFKKSPVCPISSAAESEFEAWLVQRDGAAELAVARIDVIDQRALARGLTELLGIRHESPQALLFRRGTLRWHDSHQQLTRERFLEEVGEANAE